MIQHWSNTTYSTKDAPRTLHDLTETRFTHIGGTLIPHAARKGKGTRTSMQKTNPNPEAQREEGPHVSQAHAASPQLVRSHVTGWGNTVKNPQPTSDIKSQNQMSSLWTPHTKHNFPP